MSRFLDSSPVGDRCKGELLVELNSQLTNTICLFMSDLFPSKAMHPDLLRVVHRVGL